MFEKSITTSYLRSSKLVFSAFAALLLCGILITISQFEGAETLLKGKNYAQPVTIASRKLQALEVNKTRWKDIALSKVGEEKGIEKRAAKTKSDVAYTKIITELLNDNKILQQTLNETLQALKSCVRWDISNCQKKYKCLLPEEENKRNSDTTGKFHVLATKLKTDEEAKFKLTDAETEISFSSDRSSHSLHYNSVTTLPLANSAETSTKNKSVLTNAENLSPEFHLKHSSINVSKNILTNSSQQKEETSNFKSNLTTNE